MRFGILVTTVSIASILAMSAAQALPPAATGPASAGTPVIPAPGFWGNPLGGNGGCLNNKCTAWNDNAPITPWGEMRWLLGW